MSSGVIANPVAALLILTYDRWPTALQHHCGIASRVHWGISVIAHTAKRGWRVYILLTTADETYRQKNMHHVICFFYICFFLNPAVTVNVLLLNTFYCLCRIQPTSLCYKCLMNQFLEIQEYAQNYIGLFNCILNFFVNCQSQWHYSQCFCGMASSLIFSCCGFTSIFNSNTLNSLHVSLWYKQYWRFYCFPHHLFFSISTVSRRIL